MFNFFGGIKSYAILALGVLVSGLVIALKVMAAKAETLESKVKLQKKNAEEAKAALKEQENTIRLNDEASKIDEDIRRSGADSNRDRLRKYKRSKGNQSSDV